MKRPKPSALRRVERRKRQLDACLDGIPWNPVELDKWEIILPCGTVFVLICDILCDTPIIVCLGTNGTSAEVTCLPYSNPTCEVWLKAVRALYARKEPTDVKG